MGFWPLFSNGGQRVGAFEKVPLNIRMQWNAGTACVSACVLKTLACPGLRVGPSKAPPWGEMDSKSRTLLLFAAKVGVIA